MRVLVVGGAGYIGSHTVRALLRAGHDVEVFDDMSAGHAASVAEGVKLTCGDILSRDDLAKVFDGPSFDAMMHFAAKTAVGDSVKNPEHYYEQNVQGSLVLFGAARRAGVKGVVFSSSAACYGLPEKVPITEDSRLAPINPYGWTKRMMEQMLADFAAAYGLPSVSLRYFNAAGSEPDGAIGEDHRPESHLIPRVLFAARDGGAVSIFGTDYDTRDGTAVRDYIHVTDLAEAHVLAMGGFEDGRAKVYNLGSGSGFTVREVIDVARNVAGQDFEVEEGPRRAGDPPSLVASSDKFKNELGWAPKLDSLERIIETAWAWFTAHPKGYDA